MAILEIVKENTSENYETSHPKNVTKSKSITADRDVSLNNLNHKKNNSFDFARSNNPEMAFGRLKTERGITGTIISTLINVIIFFAILVGSVYAYFKLTDTSFVFFKKESYYTLEVFNSELGKLLFILLLLLFVTCILCAVFINTSVRIRFRKYYLNKNNIYVYDLFLGMLNVLLFIIIGVIFFYVINSYNSDFVKWYAEKAIDPEVNLSIIDIFKYVIVIIIAIFISLNTIRGISLTYEKNKFIFENHL